MKRDAKSILATALITAISVAAAAGIAEAGDRKWSGGRHGGLSGPGGMMLFERFDTDGDGRVTQAEIDSFQISRLSQFDADSDGNLSLEEFQNAWIDAMRPIMVDRFQKFDKDGDALITSNEFQAPFSIMVSRLDRNDDGAVSQDERRHRGDRRGDHGGGHGHHE